MAYGTLSTLDILLNTAQTVAETGEDAVWAVFAAELAVHNRLFEDLAGDLAVTTTDRQRTYGRGGAMVMEEIDELGTPDAQKVTGGIALGFPLRRFAVAVQWTRHFFQRAPVSQVAAQFDAIRRGDLDGMTRAIKRAIFIPTNYTFNDRLAGRAEQRIDLAVKRLVNADSVELPMGPNGETFTASTHTHYLGTASFVAANLSSLIATVAEHYAQGSGLVYINRAQEAAVRAFTGFVPYVDARIIPASTATSARTSLDMNALFDRPIGLYDGFEVWIKPWIPAAYVFAFLSGIEKPLVMRVPNVGSRGLTIEADDEVHPLRAQVMAHEYGFGVWNRTNGAVLDTVNASYTAPTIT